MPLKNRSSKGTETFAKRFVEYGLIWRYSIFLLASRDDPRQPLAFNRCRYPFVNSHTFFPVVMREAVRFRIVGSSPDSSQVACEVSHPTCHNLPVCGRYRLSRRKQIIEEHFDCGSEEPDWTPRYNIAPTQPVPVIRQNPKEPVRELALMKWGLIPSWSKDASDAARMINARSESASTKPTFRDALKSRRCLIPADGFYEWMRTGKAKQPYCFEVDEGELFAFAGIWDRWRDPSGQWVQSCSILTTTPNAVTAAVHDRMPVILDPDTYDVWLDPGMQNVAAASELLKPYDARLVRCYPASIRINNVVNDDAECSAPVEVAETQVRLF
jgi:putative SOS response-associated peptidase YedK